jgi:D-amino-acid oxidase
MPCGPRCWTDRSVGQAIGLRAVPLNPDRSIAVIGGGISGITTAIVLRLIGYQTVLYSDVEASREPDSDRPPEFATVHAAASVLPHSVASSKMSDWTAVSQAFFRALCFRACCGVRSQLHYEIFEEPVTSIPPYARSVENFELLSPDEARRPWVPRRPEASETHGWKFDAFFCEGPEYVRYLYSLYCEIGGRIRQSHGLRRLPAYLELDHDVYVNCTGMGTYWLLATSDRDARLTDQPGDPDFETLIDPVPAKLIRGHYLRVAIRAILTGERGRFFSYNYKPLAEIYRTSRGLPADVYCYPRSDSWILGGSRQEGHLDGDGHWVGEETIGEEIEFSRADAASLAIPAPVLRLNSDILSRLTDGGLDLERLIRDDPSAVAPGFGYRFVRDSESDSVRLSCSRLEFSGERKYVLHNYGHGGSGYTLSWGCAFDVLKLLGRLPVESAKPRIPPETTRFAIGSAATCSLLVDVLTRLLARDG